MNMKSILFAATAALAVSLQAEVTANNTLCRIEVESSAKSVIVAVPLVAVGSGDVKVTDYIMTTNLKDGDSILMWDTKNTKWVGWVISSGAWVALTDVSTTGGVSAGQPATDSALERGTAVWLNRSSATIEENDSFYLYGQVASSTAEGVTLTAQAGGYTLLGNPTTADLDLSNSDTVTWSNCTKGDQILFAGSDGKMKSYTYRSPSSGGDMAWCKKTVTVSDQLTTATWTAITTGDVTLAPGAGFWYNSKGSDSPSVTIK